MPTQPEIQNKHTNDQLLELARKLLEQSGVDPNDFQNALTALDIAKKQNPANASTDKKNYKDKTLVYPDTEDAFIYKRGDTKRGIWYLRLSNKGKAIFKSLTTTNKETALVAARQMYFEITGKIDRGERLKSITTDELIAIWVKQLEGMVTDIPHQGIVPNVFKSKKYWLRNWSEYIHHLRLQDKPIDKIKPSATRGFATWLNERPKQTSKRTGARNREQINNNINEVNKMYHQVAIKDRYISTDDMPQIDRLKYKIDDTVKRDIPSKDDYQVFYKYLMNTYTTKKHNKEVDPRELEKRKIFKEFVLIIANSGIRPKELLGVMKSEISEVVGNTDSDDKDNIVIKIRRDNAKTGYERHVVCPVRHRLERVYASYRALGIKHEPSDPIFMNPNKGKYYKQPFGRMIMNNRLKQVLKASGLQEQLDKQNRSYSLYSFRHYFCYLRLLNNVPIHLLAKNMGTSVGNIESTYGHINTQLHADELTQGMKVASGTKET